MIYTVTVCPLKKPINKEYIEDRYLVHPIPSMESFPSNEMDASEAESFPAM